MLMILGIVAIVVFTIQVYKSARSNNRDARGWAALTAVIGLGLQFAVPVFVGFAMGIYLVASGTPLEDLQTGYFGLFTVVGVVGIVLSIVGMYLVMNHVSRIPDERPETAPPPPPPTFSNQ